MTTLSGMEYWLPLAWFAVIAFGIMMYVLLDGFVLGLGILAPFAEDEDQLDHMMNTAAPIWDGNETWLVLGGAGLLAAFPKVYALVLSALYLPVLLMLIALVFRGVAFEFRFKAKTLRRVWGIAFWLGSVCAAFAQGVILGAIVEGMPLQEGKYIGGAFGWFSPFSMLTGVAVVFGYALLGSAWLILKTDGELQRVARTIARPLIFNVMAFIGLVSAWLPFLDSRIMARWFEGGRFLWLSPVPIAVLVVGWTLWHSVRRDDREAWPFVLSLGVVRARLRRFVVRHVAVHRAAIDHDLAGRRTARDAGFRDRRIDRAAASDSRLHVVVVLGVQGQGRGGCGVSLSVLPASRAKAKRRV